MATATASDYLSKAGIADPAAARANLGLGTMATATASDYLSKAGNLSGIADLAVARTNLGLGTMATESASAYALLAGATFTGDVTVGAGGAASDAILTVNGGTNTARGAAITFKRGGTANGYLGHESVINGGTSSGLTWYGVTSPLKIQLGSDVLANFATAGNTFTPKSAGGIPVIAKGYSAQTAALFEARNSSDSVLASISAAGRGTFNGVTSDGVVGVAAGTLADSATNALALTATFPSVITGNRTAVSFAATSAGSSAFNQIAIQATLAAGYTGSATTYGLNVSNSAAGTAASPWDLGAANYGIGAQSLAATTGTNVGAFGYAKTGNLNIGLLGYTGIAKNGATNIAVAGVSRNTGTSPVQIGGYFGLNPSTTPATLTSAALIADNSTATDPIFVARDNGTPVFTIADGGNVTATGQITSYGQLFVDGSADAIQLRVQGHSSQTADIFKVETSAGTKIGGWDQWGQLNTQYITDTTGVSPYLRFQTNSLMAINQSNAANVAFAVRGMAGQSGLLTRWEDSSSTLLASISAAGAIKGASIGPVSASTFNILDNTGGAVATARTTDFLVNYRLIAGSTTGTEAFKSVGNSLLTVSNAAHIPVQVRGFTSQTANLQTWENSAGSVLVRVNADGEFCGTYISDLAQIAPYITMSGDRILLRNRTTTSNVPLDVRGMAGQTGDLQQWRNSAASVLASISATGAGTFNGVIVSAGYDINASHAATGTTRYGVNAVNSVATGTGNSAFGYQAATSLTTGFSNVAMGYRALYVNTTGNYNTAIGHSTLLALASGDGNTALGWNALTAANGTTKNTAVGMWAQKVLASGNYNTTVGAESQYALNGGANNTSLGYGSLQGVTTGSGNIAIGYLAGMYATTQSNELFINSINRTDRAGDIAGSIIYGVQHATPANQTLTLNAAVTATYGLATTAGVFSDSATVNVTESDKGFRVVDSSISHAGALYRDQISIGGSQAGGSAGAIFYANSDGDGIATANLVLNTVGVLGYNGITLSGSIDGNTNTTSTWYIENQITASAYGLKIRHEKGSGAPGVDAAIDISENLELITVASTTTNAGIRLPHGVAPTSPVDGQMWTDTGGVKTRIDGVTENVVGSTTLLKMEALTQAEYDLLTPDANTFYVITDGA
jgi:hypothetical protein